MPMINEAICSLHEGVAGVAEIDQVMKLGWRTLWGHCTWRILLVWTFV